MTKEEKHLLFCEAPICKCINKKDRDELVWYPGEPVCTMRPHSIFQKRQLAINRYIKGHNDFKNIDMAYTVPLLEKHSV